MWTNGLRRLRPKGHPMLACVLFCLLLHLSEWPILEWVAASPQNAFCYVVLFCTIFLLFSQYLRYNNIIQSKMLSLSPKKKKITKKNRKVQNCFRVVEIYESFEKKKKKHWTSIYFLFKLHKNCLRFNRAQI